MILTLDFSHPRGQVKKVILDNGETWTLQGKCIRCGACCEKLRMHLEMYGNRDQRCKFLGYEKQNGVEMATCQIMWNRPVFCMLYPRDPHDPLNETCGFKWEKI